MFLALTLFLNGKLNFNCRKARYNIFRRIIKKPGDLFEFHVLSKIYPNWIKARSVRGVIPYFFGTLATIYYFTYYGLYIANDWSTVSIFSFNSQTSFTQDCLNSITFNFHVCLSICIPSIRILASIPVGKSENVMIKIC